MELQDVESLYFNEFNVPRSAKIPKGSARTQEILQRSKLLINDGKTIDYYDQFYRDHKLLLKLFQVLGVMPVQRGQIGKITFSYTSVTSIYAYCLYIFTTCLVLWVGQDRILILTTQSKQFDEYIYSIIFVVFLVPHFWIPFVGWGVAHEVCGYKNSWGSFQLAYYKITGRMLEFPHLSTLIVVISTGCLILAVAFLLSLSALMEGFTLYHTTAYIHIITMINMNCALWYINCRAIGNASTSLADSFELDLKENATAFIISRYRVLWLSLSDTLQKMGNAYARTYSTYCLFMMTNITIAVYGFVSEIADHGFRFTFKEMGLLVDSGYCLALLFVFCDCSHQAEKNISYRVQVTLMNMQLSQVDVGTAKEIELFLIAIQMNPPKVSLSGYTVVNRELISSSVATMAIYLIVLLQFKISLLRTSGE